MHRPLPLVSSLALCLAACGPETTAPPPAVIVPDGPLPDPIELHGVDLAMRLDPAAEGFSGQIDLQLALGDRREAIWMHGQDLDVSTVTFTAPGAAPIPATWTQRSDTGTVRVVPEQALLAGDYTLHIEWTAAYATDLSGLFKVEERGDAFVLAKSESIQARRALPGFDEPRFKAPYRVALTVPEAATVIGNGPETARVPAEPGFVTVTLAETPPLPTYLLSLAVGPFESIDGPALPATSLRAESVPVRGFARPGRAADLGATLAVTPALVDILERAFELPFPDEKLDIVAAPAWPSGATELAGAITYREARVLLGPVDDGSLDPSARQKMLSTHAHELVHMWFGNLVTPAWWNDLWLKEGFATWGSALALTELEPEGGHDVRATQRRIRAFAADSLASSRAVREPIRGDADIRNAYDSITYGKGMAIIEMVDHGYGPAVFRPAVRDWLQANAGASTDTKGFVRAMKDASGNPALGSTFATFLDQPGVPLVQVAVDCPNGHAPSVTLRQQRYRPKGSRVRDTTRWTIPVCLAFDGDRAPVCTVLETKDQAVELEAGACPRLVRPNPGGHGYYRFTVATGQWKRLAAELPRLPAAEALMVVDSATAGLHAQNTPPEAVRLVYEAAARHPDPAVASAPLAGIAAWRRHLDPDARGGLDAWTRATWAPVQRRVAADRSPDGRLLAADLLAFDALTLELPEARTQLVARLDARLDGDSQALPSSAYDAALRVVAEDRGRAPLAELTRRIVDLDDPSLERAALTAAGHLRDPQQRAAAFDEVLTGDLDPRVAYARVAALMSSENASRQADVRARIEQDWDRLSEVIPGQWRRRLPRLWAGAACARSDAEGLRTWMDSDAALVAPGHARVLAQTIEQIELCDAADWLGTAIPRAFK